MIRYKLICKKCDNSFDSWFFSSDEYEKLKKKNFLTCYNCNSLKVEKTENQSVKSKKDYALLKIL